MKYSTEFDEKSMARAQGVGLAVSMKQSAEVCRFIKGKKYTDAVRLLEGTIAVKTPVPYTRFNRGGTGHRPKIGPGRYPVKSAGYILKLLKSAQANASQKSLNINSLVVKAAIAKQGPKTMHYGRARGRKAKKTQTQKNAPKADTQ